MFKFFLFTCLSILSLGIDSVLAAVNVSTEEVEDAIKKEFSEQGLEDEIELEIYGGQSSFNFPEANQAKIMVSNLKYDETQNKFTINVEIFADGKSSAKDSLIGKYYLMEEVFVPAENLDKGQIIQEQNLKKIKLRSSRIKSAYITEKEKLIGKEVKRALKIGKLISSKEIGMPLAVHKNDKVNLIYKTERMQIIAKGIAQEDGSKGEKIEVENSQSRKKVYGTVVSSDTIEVENQ